MTDFDGFSLTACLQCAIYAYHTSAYPAPNCTLDLARKTFSLNTNQSRVYASFFICFMIYAKGQFMLLRRVFAVADHVSIYTCALVSASLCNSYWCRLLQTNDD